MDSHDVWILVSDDSILKKWDESKQTHDVTDVTGFPWQDDHTVADAVGKYDVVGEIDRWNGATSVVHRPCDKMHQ